MKTRKIIVSLVLVVVMIVGSVSTVFALTNDGYSYPYWKQRPFPTRSTTNSGTKSEASMLIQKIMNVKGYKDDNGGTITADGYYGVKTAQAVLKFQKAAFSNSSAWDSKVGPDTWEKLQGVCSPSGTYTDGTAYQKWNCGSNVVARHYSNGVWYYGDNKSNKIM